MKQVTQNQYDERFYYDEDRVNIQTGGHWFPSATFLLKWSPIAPQLLEWIGNKGHEEAKRIMNRRGEIGSYIHNALELMIKDGIRYAETPSVDEKGKIKREKDTAYIEDDWRDLKEILFIKRALQGGMNFFEKFQPKVLEAEESVCGEDYAGTKDLKCTLNVDDHKAIWCLDYKTSKSIYESHKLQAEGYRRADDCDRAGIIQLGNTTKQRFTFHAIPEKDHDTHWEKFQAIKRLFYLDYPDPKPTEEAFPEYFLLPNTLTPPD